jgi:hypothetical protein
MLKNRLVLPSLLGSPRGGKAAPRHKEAGTSEQAAPDSGGVTAAAPAASAAPAQSTAPHLQTRSLAAHAARCAPTESHAAASSSADHARSPQPNSSARLPQRVATPQACAGSPAPASRGGAGLAHRAAESGAPAGASEDGTAWASRASVSVAGIPAARLEETGTLILRLKGAKGLKRGDVRCRAAPRQPSERAAARGGDSGEHWRFFAPDSDTNTKSSPNTDPDPNPYLDPDAWGDRAGTVSPTQIQPSWAPTPRSVCQRTSPSPRTRTPAEVHNQPFALHKLPSLLSNTQVWGVGAGSFFSFFHAADRFWLRTTPSPLTLPAFPPTGPLAGRRFRCVR